VRGVRPGAARRLGALLVDLDDDGQDEVVFYCPVCAEREFDGVEQSGEVPFPFPTELGDLLSQFEAAIRERPLLLL
jgi:hypothetical protein